MVSCHIKYNKNKVKVEKLSLGEHMHTILRATKDKRPMPKIDAARALYNKLVALGNVAVGHLADKVGIRIEEHDVKVLDGMDGLESGPILEPHDLLGSVHAATRMHMHEI